MRDTIMFLLGFAILSFLFWFICYDFYLAATNQTTLSIIVRQWVADHLHQPHILVGAGVIIGFVVGLVLGFILGHLFWT
jgi:ABC-type nitrate/sulfonate/bicarbonate transport system permease component